MKKHHLFMGIMAGLASAQAAYAQTPAPTSLEEVVVTAQRRSENLQNVPISVTAITPRGLAANNVDSTLQLQKAVPGLIGVRIGASFQPYIRGVGTNQTAQGSENSVAVYIDGVYQGFKAGNLFEFNGIDRIEVLKGPQGTLFGRNATGGAISIVTRDPSSETAVEAEVGVGSFHEKRAKVYATGQLFENLTMNIAYSGRWNDGYIRDTVRGTDASPYRSQAVLGKLKWTPTDAFTSVFSGGYGKIFDPTATTSHTLPGIINQAAASGIFIPKGHDESSISTAKPIAGGTSSRATWDNRYELGGLELVSITGYIENTLFNFTDQDASTASISQISTRQFAKQFSQEFQIQSNKGERLTWIAGAFYLSYRDYYGNKGTNNWSNQANVPDPVRPADLRVAGASVTGRSTGVDTTSYSAFAEGKYAILEATHLTAGLRYTSEKKHLEGRAYAYSAVAGRPEQDFGLTNGVLGSDGLIFAATVNGTVDLAKTFEKLTWRFVLDHDFSEDVMGYASVQRGFKSGGFNPSLVTNNQPPINPEVIDAYEAGVKSEFMDRTLRVNASVFYNKFRDIQVALSTTGGGSVTQNAGSARMYGADIEVVAIPVTNLTVNATASFLNSKYTEFPAATLALPRSAGYTCVGGPPLTYQEALRRAALTPSGGNCGILALDAKGLQTLYSPKLTLNLSGTYDMFMESGSKVSVTAGYYYNSGFSFAPGGIFTSSGKFGQLSASVGWSAPDDRYYVRVFGDNLADKRYPRLILGSGQTFWTVSSPPRTWGMLLGAKF